MVKDTDAFIEAIDVKVVPFLKYKIVAFIENLRIEVFRSS
jgi:hypothetical protein